MKAYCWWRSEAAKDFKVIQSFHIKKKKQFPIKNENKDSIT